MTVKKKDIKLKMVILYADQNPKNLQIHLMQKEVESKKQAVQNYIKMKLC